jgi:hypothetical protein
MNNKHIETLIISTLLVIIDIERPANAQTESTRVTAIAEQLTSKPVVNVADFLRLNPEKRSRFTYEVYSKLRRESDEAMRKVYLSWFMDGFRYPESCYFVTETISYRNSDSNFFSGAPLDEFIEAFKRGYISNYNGLKIAAVLGLPKERLADVVDLNSTEGEIGESIAFFSSKKWGMLLYNARMYRDSNAIEEIKKIIQTSNSLSWRTQGSSISDLLFTNSDDLFDLVVDLYTQGSNERVYSDDTYLPSVKDIAASALLGSGKTGIPLNLAIQEEAEKLGAFCVNWKNSRTQLKIATVVSNDSVKVNTSSNEAKASLPVVENTKEKPSNARRGNNSIYLGMAALLLCFFYIRIRIKRSK